MRALPLLPVLLLAGCASGRTAVTLPVPTPTRGEASIVAQAVEPLGDVQPIAVAMTNGRDGTLQLDPTQVFARDASQARTGPLPPAEAARRAGGRTLPGGVKGAAVGAARGGAMGAVGSALNGLIMGTVSGGVGLSAAAGAAVGGLFGAISGASSGAGKPDVAGFEDRALHAAALAPTFSASGYVYYPPGEYESLEVLLVGQDGAVEAVVVSLTPAPD